MMMKDLRRKLIFVVIPVQLSNSGSVYYLKIHSEIPLHILCLSSQSGKGGGSGPSKGTYEFAFCKFPKFISVTEIFIGAGGQNPVSYRQRLTRPRSAPQIFAHGHSQVDFSAESCIPSALIGRGCKLGLWPTLCASCPPSFARY